MQYGTMLGGVGSLSAHKVDSCQKSQHENHYFDMWAEINKKRGVELTYERRVDGDLSQYRISSVWIGVDLRLPKHEEIPVVVKKKTIARKPREFETLDLRAK